VLGKNPDEKQREEKGRNLAELPEEFRFDDRRVTNLWSSSWYVSPGSGIYSQRTLRPGDENNFA